MTNERTNGSGVKSDETLFSIVDFLRDRDGAGVTEIADALGLAKSSVHDHLSSMAGHGFVTKRDGKYYLGLEFFHVGQSVRNQFAIYEAAQPVVDSLVEETGEMVWLTTHENGRVIYLYGDVGETNLNANLLIGSWAHMHCNSGGKAILAHLSESEIDSVIDRYDLPAQTPNTITDPDVLRSELETIRERGYALNLGEDLEGIHAVAVPLLFDDEVKGALSIAGPAHRVDRERCEDELAEKLFASRNDIELNLVYT